MNDDNRFEIINIIIHTHTYIYCTVLTLGTVVVPCRIIFKYHHV